MMLTLKKCIPLILLWMASVSHSSRNGAPSTSCYNHTIIHRSPLEGPLYRVESCTNNTILCSSVNLTVSCPGEQDQMCCMDLGSKILYTYCDYMFQWSTVTNFGFLVQARIVPDRTTTFDASTTIIGTWNGGPSHKPLYCNSSSSAVDEVPVPNSVTQSMVYIETDPNTPQNINMTWNTTNPTSAETGNVTIAFFYTISRSEDTNFLPYTTLDLNYQLAPNPTYVTTSVTDPSDTTTSTTIAGTTAGTRGSSSFLPTAATTGILVLLSVFMCS